MKARRWMVTAAIGLVAGTAAAQEVPVEPGGEAVTATEESAPVVAELPEGTQPAVEPRLPAVRPMGIPASGGEDEGGPVPGAGREPAVESGGVTGAVPAAAGGEEPSESSAEGDLEWLRSQPEGEPILALRRGSYSLYPTGLLQMVVVPWQGEDARIASGGLVDAAGFRFRRVRAGVVGEIPWGMGFELQLEMDGDGARLLDAVLSWEVHQAFAIHGGAGKAPFSGSMLTPASMLTFLDRPWGIDGTTGDGRRVGIAPDRQLGVWASGAWSVLRYRAGVFNGNDDYFRGNNGSGMLYAVRLEVHPLGDLPEGQLTVADGAPLMRIGAAYYYNDDDAGGYHGVEGDLKFRWAGLTVEGEFLWSRFTAAGDATLPPGTDADVDKMAYYGQVGYLVVPEWLELAARFDGFEWDDGVDDFNDRWGVSAVANLFLLRNRVKVSLEYTHLQEWSDPQIPNDMVALQVQGRL